MIPLTNHNLLLFSPSVIFLEVLPAKMRFSVLLFFLFPLPILTHRHTSAVSSAGHDHHCGTRDVSAEEMTKMEKDLHAAVQDGDRKLQVSLPIQVPVKMHIIYEQESGIGNLSDSVIFEQMDIMNSAFEGTFNFDLNPSDIYRYANSEWFENCTIDENTFKENIRPDFPEDGPDVLHFYSCNTTVSNLLGYATFPFDFAVEPLLDGVVCGFNTFPGVDPESVSNLGITAVHEVGHWLGLFHPFQGGCEFGDGVDDTPAQAEPNYDCPDPSDVIDTCPNQGTTDLFFNFMDYHKDECMESFTAGQVQRMIDAWTVYRSPAGQVASVPNSECSGALPLSLGIETEGTTFGALGDFATLDNADWSGCPEFEVGSPGVFYTVEGTGTELVASVCNEPVEENFDLVLFTGECAQLTCLVHGFNPFGCASIAWQSEPGTTYTLRIATLFSSVTDFVVDVKEVTPVSCCRRCEIVPFSSRVLHWLLFSSL